MKTTTMLALGVLMLTSYSALASADAGRQGAADASSLPPGASVVTTPTGGTVTFKDGSFIESTPVGGTVSGRDAIAFFISTSRELGFAQKVLRTEDVARIETNPTGVLITFTDGSSFGRDPSGVTIGHGLAAMYATKLAEAKTGQP